MALATIGDCKNFVRKETTDEDASFFTPQLARVKAAIERELGYLLTGAARTHVDYNERDNHGSNPVLTLPGPFKTSGPAPVVTDVDGSTVNSADYSLDTRGMMLRAKAGVSFTNRPYTIVATIGLDQHPDYSANLESIVNQAIVEFVAYLYKNRTPGVSSFSEEGGGAVVYEGNGIPTRIPAGVMEWIDLLPGRRGGMVLA